MLPGARWRAGSKSRTNSAQERPIMKAAVFTEEKRLVVQEVPDPTPEPDEIVMRVAYCAICGSDLHRYAYGMMSPGTIMGHEFSGTVVAVGSRATQWKVGDRVTRSGGRIDPGRDLPNMPPRYSAKARGFMGMKPGAYAQYLATPAEKVMAIPEGVSDLDASLLEPLAVAVHAVRSSKLKLGDCVAVLGAGPIGLLVGQCARRAGAARLFVSETNPARRRAAEALGAQGVFRPGQTDVVQEVVRRTGIGADVAFDCAGARPTLQQALELVRMGGQVVVVALAWEPVDCLPVEWVGREVELKSVYSHLNSEWPIAMGLLASGEVQVTPLVSRVIALEALDAAFRELLDPENELVQVVVQCNDV
jgi:2-desacetyl-2-hydroxyethyl bacteriochlorophyllide A dehydrogenase